MSFGSVSILPRFLRLLVIAAATLAPTLVLAQAGPQPVVLNEVHYDQATGEQEFVELYATTGPVNMTGWTIADQDEMTYVLGRPANPSFPCTGTFTLNAGDRVVISQGAGTSVCTGAVRQIFLNRATFLQSAGDDLVLRDGSNACRDYVAFETGASVNPTPSGCTWTGPNPTNGNTVGRSISRFDVPLTDTNRGVDWEASGATTTTGPKSAGVRNVAIACSTNAACDDANPCTDDVCQNPGTAQSVCARTNNTASCNDGNACTDPDTCSGGVCVGGPSSCSVDVYLNEVHYDQGSGEQEFVELYATSGPVDMTGWTLLDQDEMTYVIGRPANPSFPCTGAFVLNAGDRVVIWQGAGTNVCTGAVRHIYLNRATFLQKDGDDLVLRLPNGVCRDYVAFESSSTVNAPPASCPWTGPNPTNGNVAGRSVSRFDVPFNESNTGADWEASGATSTTGPKSPGAVNVNAPVIVCSSDAECADTNPCTDDVCQNPGTFSSACVHTNNSAPCSDNNACTDADTCANGACVSGANLCACSSNADCNDNNVCTTDVCQNPATPSAICVQNNNTDPCSDGNPCTGPDSCSNGSCVSGPVGCADGVFLNEVNYDQASGEQEFIELYATSGPVDMTGWTILDQDEMTFVLGRPANPTFPCTGTFTLNAGDRVVIWQGAGTNVCTGTVRHIYLNRATFLQKDGDDVVLRLPNGTCRDYVAFESSSTVNAPPASCPWTGPNPTNGNVAGRSVSRFDVPFTDTNSGGDWEGSGATSTTGPKSPGAVNVNAPVIACSSDAECADTNPCTDDVCQNPGTFSSACAHTNNTAPCSDNNACTDADTCANGACVSGANLCACSADADCNDGNACTTDVCQNPATPSAICVQNNNTDPCSDGNPCTGPDSCSNGSCVSGPVGCADGVFLNEVNYDQASGEQEFIELYATSGPVDMTGWTILDQDEMTFVLGRPANPTFPCTGTFTLNAGDRVVLWHGAGTSVCTGAVRQIFMNRATFLQKDGDDVVLRLPNGTCRDYVAFESSSTVNAPPASCPWTGPNPTNGNVAGRSVSRFDVPFTDTNSGGDWEGSGATSTNGPKSAGAVNVTAPVIACSSDAECADTNPCTDDVCQNPGTFSSACAHTNNTAPCSDNNACTDADTCANGACVSGANLCACSADADCNDGNACTTDVCQNPATPSAICVHNNNTDPCSDGNPCTGPDSCSNGSCVSGPVGCADGVFLNEVNYDQASGEQEFIELYATSGPVDMTGWTILDQDEMTFVLGRPANPTFPCTGTFTLNAGDRVVLWHGAGTSVCTGAVRQIFMNRATFLQKEGDDVVLRSADSACRDYVAFETGVKVNPPPAGCAWTGPNPSNGDTLGRSISRFDAPVIDNNLGSDWERSGTTTTISPKTPGARNVNASVVSCGDGAVNQPGEQCDDGNLNNNDACSNNCTQGCGNSIVNTGEFCDDGNQVDDDACTNTCTQGPHCGDGLVNVTGETCDDGNTNDNDTCSNNCTQGCGNGIVNTGEACDDGNLVDNDACSNDCTAGCGNGIVNTGEACDDGNLVDNDACSNNCTNHCGNGFVNPPEPCDDGNTVNDDACSNNCTNHCGNGFVNPPEACDDANTNNNDACSNNCTSGCGNGIVNTGESCDDGNLNDNDDCSNNCTQGCGNGIINGSEACDDGNQTNDDACSNNCTNHCGNGFVNPPEACDDANSDDNDTCSNNCTSGCGNGIVNTGETCDDGDTDTNDDCSNDCTAGCGNGIVNTGEECDDGNTNPTDACDNTCELTPFCGDGEVNQLSEQCDDGNTDDNDDCSNDCTEGCGNSIVNTGENCDDGNVNDNDSCSNDCTDGCGNGIVNTGEVCDDGNTNDNDDCSNNCTTGCGNGIVNTGEQCDDGNTFDIDECSNGCLANALYCGDGTVNQAAETCDDGNGNNVDECSNNCTGGCGNGIVNTGDECDDGNLDDNDACSNDCTAGCGNGIVNTNEACDDGNGNDNDACSNNCTQGCGNGIVNGTEACDDGNPNDNDACSNNCTQGCGNGIINGSEVCDDGNLNDNDACSNNCTQGCGNGIVNGTEACDDGNLNDNDNCSNNCTQGCGNGFVNTGEACDDGNLSDNDACSNNCTNHCGNGFVNPPEACDDGNGNNDDACSNNCTNHCGNGFVNPPEACDDGNTNNNDNCSNNCTQGCGNGIINGSEACDDGNGNNDDACSNNCTNHCGNGFVNPPEACDDGNTNDNDNCSNNCTQGCGNGIINGSEACDDGNLNNNDACSNNCTNHCGNGFVNPPEACDDGNSNNNDACSNNCTQGCGNGIVNSGEACDDGNTLNNDACSNNCTNHCGNGFVNPPEACDDGNTNTNDACSNNCTQGCGNGIVNTGEFCDDGNLNNNDACSNNCTGGCGNGIINGSEACDDGNTINTDACSNNCTNHCGNGIVNTGETCDDGNSNNNDNCSNNCTSGCGNGIVNTGETCDDGNGNTNDACSNNCTSGCGNGIVNTGEQCDDGNSNNNDNCSNSCVSLVGLVLISEVHYEQGAGEQEFIEIVASGSPTDITGWVLTDNDAVSPTSFSMTFTTSAEFPCSTPFVLNSGDRLVIWQGIGTSVCTGSSRAIYINRSVFLAGAAEDLALRDTSNVCRDYVAFEGASTLPSGCTWAGTNPINAGVGGSISRIDSPMTDTNNGSDWVASGGASSTFGPVSPGRVNVRAASDSDGDGDFDANDNCPTVANANQADSNGNGVGNACEGSGSALIAEVQYEQAATAHEFIELLGTGAPVNMTGWKLGDNDTPTPGLALTMDPTVDPRFPCPTPFHLLPGDRLVVYQGGGNSICSGTSRSIYLNQAVFMPGTGDDLVLRDAANTCRDYVAFESGGTLPADCAWTGPNPSNGGVVGTSLARTDSPVTDTNTGADWGASSPEAQSPGLPNN